MYCTLRNVPRGLVQRPVIKSITISAAKRMNIHTKWDKQRQQTITVYLHTEHNHRE
jgi:hypothetical protein